MMRNKLKWLLPVVLAGTFAAAPSSFARGQFGPESVNNRVDRRQDRRALRRDERKIDRRQARLHADVRHYGRNSARARIDRCQLRHARHQFRYQARDLRQDSREALRR
jgi:hypothetical protein